MVIIVIGLFGAVAIGGLAVASKRRRTTYVAWAIALVVLGAGVALIVPSEADAFRAFQRHNDAELAGLVFMQDHFPSVAIALFLMAVGAVVGAIIHRPAHAGSASPGATRTCPYCAEAIQAAAVFCKHCRRDLPSSVAQLEPLPKD